MSNDQVSETTQKPTFAIGDPIQLGDATLALRPYEIIRISDNRLEPKRNVFGVAIAPVPDLPGPRESKWRDTRPAAIVAITFFPHLDGWGFIHLEPETKKAIGDMMFDRCNCETGKWYRMDLSQPVDDDEAKILLRTFLDQIDGDVRATQWFDARLIERAKAVCAK